MRDGYFDLGAAPGLGIEVDGDLGERYRMPEPLSCTDGMYSDIMFHAGNAPDARLCLEEAGPLASDPDLSLARRPAP